MSNLKFPLSSRSFLSPYLPPDPISSHSVKSLPFVTLTYATSLDSSISLAPGTQTHLSGPESKAMTHYLRSKHSAILIGVGTALADDPGLNCRLEGVDLEEQPRPVIVDPKGRWNFTGQERILKSVKECKGKAPLVISARGSASTKRTDTVLEAHGGEIIEISAGLAGHIAWENIFTALKAKGLDSIMVEGGGTVINDLLGLNNLNLVSSVIVTIAPTYLGRGSVVVSPEREMDRSGLPVAAVKLGDVGWLPMGQDVVMCGKPLLV